MTVSPSSYVVQQPSTAVVDRSIMTVTYVQGLLGIEPCTQADKITKLVLGAAKKSADEYMQNPFLQGADIAYDDLVNWSGKGRVDPNHDPVIVDTHNDDLGARTPYSVPNLYADPVVELDIPQDVELGLVEFVRAQLNMAPAGVSQEKVGDWQRTFAVFATVPDRMASIKSTYWSQYRIHAGF